MYKHQVIGTRRAKSWRSRRSKHIVGVCTLEALDENGRVVNFARNEDWVVNKGAIEVGSKVKSGLTPKCRYWSLEEVIEAMSGDTPKHEFYTRDSGGQNKKITVYGFQGAGNRWIKTVGDSRKSGNLHWQEPTRVPCPLENCPVIPSGTAPVSRGGPPDC